MNFDLEFATHYTFIPHFIGFLGMYCFVGQYYVPLYLTMVSSILINNLKFHCCLQASILRVSITIIAMVYIIANVSSS